jgi:hypothetical protein
MTPNAYLRSRLASPERVLSSTTTTTSTPCLFSSGDVHPEKLRLSKTERKVKKKGLKPGISSKNKARQTVTFIPSGKADKSYEVKSGKKKINFDIFQNKNNGCNNSKCDKSTSKNFTTPKKKAKKI